MKLKICSRKFSSASSLLFLCTVALCTTASAEISIAKGSTKTRSEDHPKSLSGITYAGSNTFYMVTDNASENGIYSCKIELSKNGKTITSLEIPTPDKAIKLKNTSDLEACAFDPSTGNVWVSDETSKTVKEYDPKTGNVLSTLEIPAVMKKNLDMENNFGIEGVTISPDGLTLWLCNEEALYVDGKRSSGKDGTTVRIVKYTRPSLKSTFMPVSMYAYKTDKWEYDKSIASRARGGVTALCALPDGSLLVLERQLSFKTESKWTSALSNSLTWKIYHISDFSTATDIMDFASLDGAKYTAATKKLLAEDGGLLTSNGNFEGLCLGPRLSDGSITLIMVADADDGYSKAYIRPLVLSGL